MVCLQCGEEFTAANSGLDSPARLWRGRPRQYCSDACRMRAYRSRRAESAESERGDGSGPPVDPERELARTARELAAELAAATGAVKAALPPERASRRRRSDGLRQAAADARRAAAAAAALALLLEPATRPDPPAEGPSDGGVTTCPTP
jgi:hypothetical protein